MANDFTNDTIGIFVDCYPAIFGHRGLGDGYNIVCTEFLVGYTNRWVCGFVVAAKEGCAAAACGRPQPTFANLGVSAVGWPAMRRA